MKYTTAIVGSEAAVPLLVDHAKDTEFLCRRDDRIIREQAQASSKHIFSIHAYVSYNQCDRAVVQEGSTPQRVSTDCLMYRQCGRGLRSRIVRRELFNRSAIRHVS